MMLYRIIEQVQSYVLFDKVDGLSQHLLRVIHRTAHHGEPQRTTLPQFRIVDFRYRDIKAIVKAVFQTLDDLAFALERPALGQVELHLTGQYNQCRPRGCAPLR